MVGARGRLQRGFRLFAYKCPDCRTWHLTKQPHDRRT